MTESAQDSTFKNTALEILRLILKAYGFREEMDVPEEEVYDFRINVVDGDHVLTLDIDADEETRCLLIGKEDSNLRAMQRILIGALHRRLGHGLKSQKLDRFVRLAVNGKYLDPRRENGDKKRTDDERRRRPEGGTPVVVITYPPGVEIRTRVASE